MCVHPCAISLVTTQKVAAGVRLFVAFFPLRVFLSPSGRSAQLRSARLGPGAVARSGPEVILISELRLS